MRKVVIVDDEKWVRIGLIGSIPWEALGLELAGEAANGREGIELAMRVRPDILFLDMRMPGVDGREMIGILQRELPGTVTIVVSGYSDFEYTKEAIRHRAFEYLLKPVKKEELASVLQRALEELERRERRERSAAADFRERWLRRRLLHPGGEAEPETSGLREEGELAEWWSSGEVVVIAGCPDRFDGGRSDVRLVQAVREKLEQERAFLFEGKWDFIVTTAPDESAEAVVAAAVRKPDAAGLQRLAALLPGISRQLADAPSFSFGTSAWHSPDRLADAWLEARGALKGRKLGETGSWLKAGRPAAKVAYLYEEEKELLLALRAGNGENVRKAFDRFFGAVGGPGSTVEALQRSAVMLVHSLEKQLQAEGSRLEEAAGKDPARYAEAIRQRGDADSMRRLLEDDLLAAALRHYGRCGEKHGERIVREIEKMIGEFYSQPLSMVQVAAMHYMNPDYLGRLFKRITGKSFTDYLTDVRIDKAKEQLRYGNAKNYEIAQAVGYEDYRYFSQIFKKKTGLTIGEYRESVAVKAGREESGT
jgi:YesN/AraC family two-component response regulator